MSAVSCFCFSRVSFLSGLYGTHAFPCSRTHANGSIKRGCKDNATDSVPLRTGIGVQLKDIKVFNRDRQKGEQGQPGRGGRGTRREVRTSGALSSGSPELGAGSWEERLSSCVGLDTVYDTVAEQGSAEIPSWDPRGQGHQRALHCPLYCSDALCP